MSNHKYREYDHHGDPSVEEVSELLEVASKKVPELITNILNTLYSQKSASDMGRAVGSLYKELVDAGIPQEVAVQMAKDYMFSLKDVMKNFNDTHHQGE
ncbi:hypothetical protein [Chengkuizengella axinellae]|uniref:Uncharacterized protein n=1 Tax=Chengkuizengella axinellae TaxID=3064388 RepID=A0ABT9J567_9BACL|nr:hypothetical protein [Chengkuizengella sp. 2205SS18-9]MDP5276762.1 hypothetical protein [Chengkuizengella sp. 2205SS18-9]